jgi:phage shock protein C
MTTKSLYRSCKNRILGGVCGGLGEYFEIDPVLVRLIAALLIFAGGISIIVYIIAWIIMPEDPACKSGKTGTDEIREKAKSFAKEIKSSVKTRKSNSISDERLLVGMVVIIIGLTFLFQNVLGFKAWTLFWPIILIGIGLYILLGSQKKGDK